MVLFTIIPLIFKSAKRLLPFSAEVAMICQGITFPFYEIDQASSVIIQYVSFQIITVFIISF